jgi:uncharacterized membrane protein
MPADSDRGPRLRWFLPRSVRQLPADLAVVLGIVGLTCIAVLLPGINESPLRIVIGLLFLLFIPGYAFVAALFPEQADSGDAADRDGSGGSEGGNDETPLSTFRADGIDGIERVALGFGTSISIVPLLGLVLNFSPWGIRLVPVLLTVSGFTIVATAVAASRRRQLPPKERFTVPYDRWLASVRCELFAPETRTDTALNALLVLSVLLAVASVSYAVAVPQQGEEFTEFYVLTENETGDLVADNYPTQFKVGEPKSLHVGIGNHEHQRMDYVVVVKIQHVANENNSTQVREERELNRVHASIDANETWLQEMTVQPRMEGERLRFTFLLYRDGAPAQPTVKNAYHELHLWVNVTAADSA